MVKEGGVVEFKRENSMVKAMRGELVGDLFKNDEGSEDYENDEDE